MTKNEFLSKYGGDVKAFVESPAGQAFLNVLGSLRPAYEYSEHAHLLAENRGAMRGYELCLRNAISICFIPTQVEEPQANYGVPEAKTN